MSAFVKRVLVTVISSVILTAVTEAPSSGPVTGPNSETGSQFSVASGGHGWIGSTEP